MYQEIYINGEILGNFITVTPDILDYDVCVFNSAYQLKFTVHNSSKIAQGVGVKFPSCLKNYLISSSTNMFVLPYKSQEIAIKFAPRKEIATSPYTAHYYDKETSILEFPIFVYLTSKQFSSAPGIKVTVFAILTESNGLSLKPQKPEYTLHCNECCQVEQGKCNCATEGQYIIDMGECTVAETVYAIIELTNNSYAVQSYGFLKMPKCLKIYENYGFGHIAPLETKALTLMFSPTAEDIPNYSLQCERANNTVNYELYVDTIHNRGGIEKILKPFSFKDVKNCAKIMEKELNETDPLSLIGDVLSLVDLFQNESVTNFLNSQIDACPDHHQLNEDNEDGGSLKDDSQAQAPLRGNSLNKNYVNCDVEEEESEVEINLKSNKLWVSATIIEPLCNFSQQFIEFRDTPCGSFSMMSLVLSAATCFGDDMPKCVCGYVKKHTKCKSHIKFAANFAIGSDNKYVTIEPNCGSLQNGEKIQLCVIIQPQVEDNIVTEYARELKIEEILREKKLQWDIKQEKLLAAKLAEATKKGKKGKDKKGTKNKGTSTEDELKPAPPPEFIIEEKEIVLTYLDMYPATMFAWKNLYPFYIEANLRCTISYVSDDFTKQPENLYLRTYCKAIKPDFIHDLRTQEVDFGPTVIGASAKKIISVQNIQEENINPRVTYFSPEGPFKCSYPCNIELPPEYILKLPVTFTPSEVKQVTECLEIISGRTVYSLLVSGEGVQLNLFFKPEFLVCRLETKNGTFADCKIDAVNQSKAAVSINFIKICELEGEIKTLPEEKDQNARPSSKKDSKKAAKGPKKFSEDLTPEEEVSLKDYFDHKEGESYFELVGTNGTTLQVEKNSTKSVKVRFGVPIPPGEAGKGKKGKDKPSSKNKSAVQRYYVAKYNIMVGQSTFLKDFIIIAKFV